MQRAALLLDFGGVLYKPLPDHHDRLVEAIMRFLNTMGLTATRESVEKVLASWEIPGDVQQNIVYAAAVMIARHGGVPSVNRVEALVDVMVSAITSSLVVDEGAYTLLSWAKRVGVLTGIVSNNWCYECITRVLNRDELDHLIDVVISSDIVGFKKPRAEIYQAALSLLGVEPGRAAYIDDVEANVEGARRAGIRLAILHDGRRLDEYIPVLESFYGLS